MGRWAAAAAELPCEGWCGSSDALPARVTHGGSYGNPLAPKNEGLLSWRLAGSPGAGSARRGRETPLDPLTGALRAACGARRL